MKLNSLSKFNAALKKAGSNVQLVKGRGYFYFVNAELPSIYVNAYSQLSAEQWRTELEEVLKCTQSTN